MGARLNAARLAPYAAPLVLLLVATPAGAQSDPEKGSGDPAWTPTVEVRGDGGLDARKLESLVALELGKDAARVSRVAIEVRGRSAAITLVVGTGKRTATVALAETEPERGVALFVGELARGPSPAPAPIVAPSPSPAPAPVVAPSPSPRWELSLLGAIGARAMTTRGALLVTPQLEVGTRAGGFRIGATARYGYTSADDALGRVDAHLFTGGLAVTDTLLARGPFTIGTGPRLELGAVAGSGDGANGTSRSAFIIAGAWAVELRVKLGPVAVLVAGEAGVSRGLVLLADDRDVLHVSGPFVGGSLGVLF